MSETANAPIFHERALWTLDDIARYASMSKSRLRESIVYKPDFPAAIRPVPSAHPKWKAGEVWAWFEAHRA